ARAGGSDAVDRGPGPDGQCGRRRVMMPRMEPISRERFDAALAAFSAIHDEDPQRPKSEIYHRTLARWVEALPPEAGPLTDALRLAARCQHLRRWSIPRSDFPLD